MSTSRVRSFQCVAKTLGDYWFKCFKAGVGKWNIVGGSTEGEGACSAMITTKIGGQETICIGEYEAGSYHAETVAYKMAGVEDDIERIEISSPPCPRCAVVLEIVGLSNKVYVPNNNSRISPSGNWDSNNKNELLDIICCELEPNEKEYFSDRIYSYFQSCSWLTD